MPMLPESMESLHAILAAIALEYGQANEDWTYATLKVPEHLTVSVPKAVVSRDLNTRELVISVKLDQPADGPKEAAPGSKVDVCVHCSRPVYLAPREIFWVHEGSGKDPCGPSNPGFVAQPRNFQWY